MRALALTVAFACATSARAADETWQLKVHLLSDDDRVELRRLAGGATLCRTPCDTTVRFVAGEEFVFAGSGIAQSDPLFFHPRNGEVSLRVRAGSQDLRTAGKVLAVAGVGSFILGVLTVMPAAAAYGLCDRGDCSGKRTALTVVEVAVVGGLISAVIGAVVLVANPPTRFSVER